jgi:hypothetical protein
MSDTRKNRNNRTDRSRRSRATAAYNQRTRTGNQPPTRPDTPPRGTSRTGRGRPPGGKRHRRALRREAPVVVGLLLDEPDFTAMTRYRSFRFGDYGTYLRQVDGLLRSLHAQGTHVAVTLFDPEAYAAYCRATRRPPDTPASRAHYVAEATTTRACLPYTRQPLAALRAELAHETERRATLDRATDILMAAGPCPDCGQALADCAFDRASHTLLRLADAIGEGTHHVVCSLPTDDGPPLLAAVHLDATPDGDLDMDDADALAVCTVIAAATVTGRLGGLVARTLHPDGHDTVRGWELRGGEPHPLTEAAVFDAYCTDPSTGDPVPPEPGVRYAAGLPLPPPLPGDLTDPWP